MKLKNAGFTLIELLVVISIIGLLASIVFVSLNNAREKARIARVATDLSQINKILALYLDNNGVPILVLTIMPLRRPKQLG